MYYHDNNGKEIDFLLLENGKIYFSVLESFQEEVGEGAVLCMSSLIVPLDEKNKIIPIKCI